MKCLIVRPQLVLAACFRRTKSQSENWLFIFLYQVQDKRDVVFEDRRTALLFPGEGQSLIGDEDSAKNHKVESQPPGVLITRPKISQKNTYSAYSE